MAFPNKSAQPEETKVPTVGSTAKSTARVSNLGLCRIRGSAILTLSVSMTRP